MAPQKNSDITAAQGRQIVSEAATWNGTAYAEIGPASAKGVKGDCSGSTFYIYKTAGFPYQYNVTATFAAYAAKTGLFRKLGPADVKQDGDLLLWPGHVAIYSTFTGDTADATTQRTNANGSHYTQTNDMWTAFNAHKDTAKPYGPFKMSYFRPDPPVIYRYQKLK